MDDKQYRKIYEELNKEEDSLWEKLRQIKKIMRETENQNILIGHRAKIGRRLNEILRERERLISDWNESQIIKSHQTRECNSTPKKG